MSQRQECAVFHRIFVAVVPLAFLIMTGCPSLSTMQTPATVPKGEVRLGMGLESVGFSEKDSSGNIKTDTVPQFEFNTRYGVTDNIDIGAKLYLLGLEFGGKYQFAKGAFEAAIAPAVSYISVTVSDSSGNDDTLRVTYLHLPLLLGFKLSDSFELAFGPKALYAIATGTTSYALPGDGCTVLFAGSDLDCFLPWSNTIPGGPTGTGHDPPEAFWLLGGVRSRPSSTT